MGWDSQGKQKEGKKKNKKKKFRVSVGWWRARRPDLNSEFASPPFASLMTEDKVFTSPSQSSLKNGDFIPPSPPNQRGEDKDDMPSVPGTWGQGGATGIQHMFSFSHPFPLSFPTS